MYLNIAIKEELRKKKILHASQKNKNLIKFFQKLICHQISNLKWSESKTQHTRCHVVKEM